LLLFKYNFDDETTTDFTDDTDKEASILSVLLTASVFARRKDFQFAQIAANHERSTALE